jgi:uncharacterized membrane protein
MSVDLRGRLEAWREAGLIDEQTAGRILEYERRPGRPLRSRWPVILTLSLGALLVGAGVLLFVSAHWDALSPAERMAVVVALVAGFHVAGASFGRRSPAMSSTLHALGTLALGAGIALTGQIFNMAEHWPSAVLLWAIGAAAAYLLLRDWPQFALLAILAPAWGASEWIVRYLQDDRGPANPFLLLLALVYLSAPRPGRFQNERRTLCVMGSVAVFPLGMFKAVTFLEHWRGATRPVEAPVLQWVLAFLAPLGVGWLLRGKDAWVNAVAAVWVGLLVLAALNNLSLAVHVLCALGSAGLIAWGLLESRSERVNLGVAGFALTVLFFYFSTLTDKLGRSVSLIALGILVLAGGWALERIRRGWIARIRGGRA